jgi:hypothetical protein
MLNRPSVNTAGVNVRGKSRLPLIAIAADPKHLGARIGLTAVLHTWGQNLDHHPMSIASCRAAEYP